MISDGNRATGNPWLFSLFFSPPFAAAEVREGLSAFVRGRRLKGEKTDAQAALVGKGRRRKERKTNCLPDLLAALRAEIPFKVGGGGGGG